MTINNANVEQINVALLDLDKRIKALNTDIETLKSLQNSVKTIKSSLKETQVGLTTGETYDINILGNAATATHAKTATTADEATSADISKTVDPVNGDELRIGSGSSQHITNAKHAASADKVTSADKAVEVLDYGDTSRTVKVGYAGPSVTAGKLDYLAGYTENNGSSVKLKNVKREELIKWLGISVVIKYADYRTEELSFSSSTDQKKIELSDFGPGITEDNVINFMVIYWTGVPIIASGDWAKSQGLGTKGLGCALHTLNANGGTGRCVVRCVYVNTLF